MGRSFGVLVVLIGLWVLAALPTRGPETDAAGTAPGPLSRSVSDIADQTALVSGTLQTSTDSRADDGPNSPRTHAHKRAEERQQAARSRDLESEPEPHLGFVPQPMPVSVPMPPALRPPSASPSASRQAMTSAAPASTGRPAPAIAAQTPASPVSPAPSSAPSASAPPTKAAAAMDARAPRVTVPPPRIVGAALRDLATPTQSERAKQPAAGSPTPLSRYAAPKAASRKRNNVQTAASVEVKPVAKPAASVERETRPSVVRPGPTRLAAAPRPQRIRVAVSYGAPAYLGRVYVQYPPQGFFVPSASYYRRSQFQPETVWSAIRRSGL